MLIECTFCKAKARLPESQEGAKVRCGACGKVYVARPGGPGKRGSTSSNAGLRMALLLGGALAVLVLVFMIMNNQGPPKDTGAPVAAKEQPPEKSIEEISGWSSPPVLAVRDIYSAVEVRNAARLAGRLHAPGILAQAVAREPDAKHPDPATATRLEADGWLGEYAQKLLDDASQDGLAAWKPHDGNVLEERGNNARVRVQVDPRDPSGAMDPRVYDFKLVREGERWKATGWERFITEEEKKAVVVARNKEIQKVTLADGSVLYVAEPRPLPHLDDTPPELRAQIDSAMQRMLDFNLPPRENNKARAEMIAFGRPAIPILLTGLYETRITDDVSASMVNMIDVALKDITGETMGFSPSTALGVSEERRDAAVKAWFAWWLGRGKNFQQRKESEDALDEFLKPTPADLRQMERDKLKSKPGG